MRIKLNSIGFQLFITGALIIIITVAALAILGYRNARRTIVAEAKRHVLSVALERRGRLEYSLKERRKAIEILVQTTVLKSPKQNLDDLISYLTSTDSPLLKLPGIINIVVMDTLKQVTHSYSPIHLNSNNTPIISLTIPLKQSGEATWTFLQVDHLTALALDPILLDSTSLGSSGEAYLVDYNMVMLTPSRFHRHPAPLTHKMPIPPVQAAMESDLGSMLYRSFLGDEVVGAYTAMPDYGWIVIAEMGTEEAFAGLRMIVVNTLGTAIIALVLMLLLAFVLTRRWTRPLENIAAASQKITSGDYAVRVPETRRRDEVGTLVDLFNRMVQGLQKSRDELKESHARLIQSEKLAAIGQFAASIVHEMRSPLSSIKMNTRLLSREADKDSVEAKHLGLADREITRMEMMLTELLDYSKPITLSKMKIEVSNLARSCIDAVRERSDKKKVVLDLNLGRAPASTIADQEQLYRAIVNLLNNSIEACSEGGLVGLRVLGAGSEEIQIIVEDNGRGMSERVTSRIFDPFFTTREGGIGLGMNIVKKVVEAHQGSIEVQSEEGKGTTICIQLPIEGNYGDHTGH